MPAWMIQFQSDFYQNIIAADRWKQILSGLGVTVQITFVAILIGTVLGFILAFMKMSKSKWLSVPANIYIEIIRGTPTTVQLLITYFVILGPFGVDKIIVAMIAFGLNSAAYISEIVRGGVTSIDIGQVEAGRSLGLSKFKTTMKIVLPQAIKLIIPTYTNEFIVLLKETSIVGYIAIGDLTKMATVIQSRTYNAYFPLITAAVIYFVMTFTLAKIFGYLERRLNKSDLR
ncbi:MAG: amino acid ABC transporter permease [Oscillospiraceae bacterium]